MAKLILASASPRRQAILRHLKIPFEVHLATCKESVRAVDPVATVVKNASLKALSVAKRYPHAVILAADTVVAFNGKVLGKPRDYEEAQAWLLDYAGRSQQVYTAVAFLKPGRRDPDLFIEATSLVFKQYGLGTVQDYLDRVKPLDRAGAYDINECGDLLIEERIGSYTNVMGLPQSVVSAWVKANLADGSSNK
ncbi:MAG: septum formation protein Maf [Kiritimatiellae bacterium]|nr:septum formation protein Maf [Kiritimatiellia bacterium]